MTRSIIAHIITILSLEVFVVPGVHTGGWLRSGGELLSAGENIVGLLSGHHLPGPLHSHTLHIQLALVCLPLQPHQLPPEPVGLLDDLVGKVRALVLSVKCKLVLRFSVGNFINPLVMSYDLCIFSIIFRLCIGLVKDFRNALGY